jgi:hypothetical protein
MQQLNEKSANNGNLAMKVGERGREPRDLAKII